MAALTRSHRCARQLREAIPRAPSSHTRAFRCSSPSYSSPADPRAIADAFLSKFSQGQSFTRSQLLDANQLRLFSLTLDRAKLWPDSHKSLEDVEPLDGTPIPAGYHLAYFTPPQLPGILGQDGTDTSFNPDPPFTRRMWAGGGIEWPGSDSTSGNMSYLRVGDVATETTRVLSCEPKTIRRTGENMLVVGVVKEFRDSKDNLCVVDKRNWVFRGALNHENPASVAEKPALVSDSQMAALEDGKIVRPFTRNAATLFRFSALTFNAHRIHYDVPWARNVEGHRDVVVHGPMNLVSMLDMWRDERGSREDVSYPKQIEYRATSPVYAGEGYRIMMDASVDNGRSDLTAVSDDGTVCMKGSITGW
jgi:hydroxyacyl-ACP dehydratase HTD2-like protein with hotdog domain